MTPMEALLAEVAAIEGAGAVVRVEAEGAISVDLPPVLRHDLPLDERVAELPGGRVGFRVDGFEDLPAALELVLLAVRGR